MSPFDPRKASQQASLVKAELASRGVVPASPDIGETVAGRFHQYSRPEHYVKATAFTDAVHLAAYFCVVNSLDVPAFCQVHLSGALLGTASRWQGGIYLVKIDANACNLPRYSDRFAGGWPGAQYDDTVVGVVAHEIGHITHWTESTQIHKRRKDIEAVARREPEAISEYEKTHPDERWAEAMRLFILNPSLLAHRWPKRYDYLSSMFHPVVTTGWEEILEGFVTPEDNEESYTITMHASQ